MTSTDLDIVQAFVRVACTAEKPPSPVTFKRSLKQPELLNKVMASLVASWVFAHGGTRTTWGEQDILEVSNEFPTEIEKRVCVILLSRNLRLTSWVIALAKAFGFKPTTEFMKGAHIASNRDEFVARSKAESQKQLLEAIGDDSSEAMRSIIAPNPASTPLAVPTSATPLPEGSTPLPTGVVLQPPKEDITTCVQDVLHDVFHSLNVGYPDATERAVGTSILNVGYHVNFYEAREEARQARRRHAAEKAALVRQRRKVKQCMLSVLKELVTQGELRRVSFVEVNVQQLSALLLDMVPNFLGVAGMEQRPTITMPFIRSLMMRTLQLDCPMRTSPRSSRLLLTSQDVWNALEPTNPLCRTLSARLPRFTIPGWMLLRNVAVLDPDPDPEATIDARILLDVNVFPHSKRKPATPSLYDHPLDVSLLYQVVAPKVQGLAQCSPGDVLVAGESLYCAKKHSVMANTDTGLEFQGELFGEVSTLSKDSFHDSEMVVHGDRLFQMHSKNSKGHVASNIDPRDIVNTVAVHNLGQDGKALRFSRHLSITDANVRLGIQYNPGQPCVHTLNQAGKVIQIVETQSVKMEVHMVTINADTKTKCVFDVLGYVERNSRDAYAKIHQVLEDKSGKGDMLKLKKAAFEKLVKTTMRTNSGQATSFERLPSFKIAVLEGNLAAKVNDRTVDLTYSGMDVSLRRVWTVEANRGHTFQKNIVPIVSAVQFVHGQQQWRLLMPSAPFVAIVDIPAGHELSREYGFDQYWGPWGCVKRDGRGAKISRETIVKRRCKQKKPTGATKKRKRKGQTKQKGAKQGQRASTRSTRAKHK